MQNRTLPKFEPIDFQPTMTTYAAAAMTTAVVMAVTEGYSAYKNWATLFNTAPDTTTEANEPTLFNSFGFGPE